jgi:hypothetical protein
LTVIDGPADRRGEAHLGGRQYADPTFALWISPRHRRVI